MWSFLRQLVLSVLVLGGVVYLWITYVPTAMPWLDRIGLLDLIHVERSAPSPDAGGMSSGARSPGDGGAPGARPASGGNRAQGGGAGGAGGRPGGGAGFAGGGFGGGPTQVIAKPVESRSINDEVTAIGDAAALRTVTVMPEVSGTLVGLTLKSGEHVEQGAVLATLDDSTQQIALDRARLLLADAESTAARYEALSKSAAASDIQRRTAELELEKARLALREAEIALEQRRIVAPISGWIGLLDVTVGDQVSPSTEIARIDDRSEVIVEFRVPERFVGLIKEGDVLSATPLARPSETLEGRITAADNRVDETSRTLRLRASVANPNDTLRPGMAFRITLTLAGEPQSAVDPLAIQWGGSGSYVWAVQDGKAARVPVRILKRDADAVLVDSDLRPGDMVITEGVQSLRPGMDVAIRTAGSAPSVGPTAAAFRPQEG